MKKIIVDKKDFDIAQTLECGQVFSFKKVEKGYEVFSKDKYAYVYENEKSVIIETEDEEYFKNYFDLNKDYALLKTELSKFEMMREPLKFGAGIRILRQDLFETIISFIVSQNNNIKRITKILFSIREKYGKDMGSYHAFSTLEEFSKIKEEDFVKMGAGYRAKYLSKIVGELKRLDLEKLKSLPTENLRNELIKLTGIGPKVADCILLFGFSRYDVFPVDTWMAKMYGEYFEKETTDRVKISKKLVSIFGKLSGYAQQYLFYYKRSLG